MSDIKVQNNSNRISTKNIILIIGMVCFLGISAFLGYKQHKIKTGIISQLTTIAESKGLENVNIIITGKSWIGYTELDRNFSSMLISI